MTLCWGSHHDLGSLVMPHSGANVVISILLLVMWDKIRALAVSNGRLPDGSSPQTTTLEHTVRDAGVLCWSKSLLAKKTDVKTREFPAHFICFLDSNKRRWYQKAQQQNPKVFDNSGPQIAKCKLPVLEWLIFKLFCSLLVETLWVDTTALITWPKPEGILVKKKPWCKLYFQSREKIDKYGRIVVKRVQVCRVCV